MANKKGKRSFVKVPRAIQWLVRAIQAAWNFVSGKSPLKEEVAHQEIDPALLHYGEHARTIGVGAANHPHAYWPGEYHGH